jgi:hypothetical protein
MTDENVEPEIEVVQEAVEPEVVEIPSDDPVEESPAEKAFDPKKDRVDFDKPEQQEKFDYVYKQLKMSDNRNAMLTDFLQKQQEQLDKLNSRFVENDTQEAEKVLTEKIRLARENDDHEAYDKAFQELVDFKATKIIDKKVNEYAAKESQTELAQAKYVASLMEEKDDTGQYKRPWLQEGHPEFDNSLSQLAVIAYKYQKDPDVLQKSLKELDQIMGSKKTTQEPPKQNRAPNPMQGSNLTNYKPKDKVTMTRAEIEIAKKLGVDPKRYAAQRDSRKGVK